MPPVRHKRERAHVLPGDPIYLHQGYTVRLMVRDAPTDFFGIGAAAAALRRSPNTVRRLEEAGVLPSPRYRSPGRGNSGQKRLYTREQVLDLRELADNVFAGRRRVPSWTDDGLASAFATSATDWVLERPRM